MRHQEHARKRDPFDALIYPLGLLAPILTIPQVLKVWAQKNASSMSMFTWAGYVACSLVWIAYGIKKRDKPIVILNGMWLVIDLLMVLAIILYS